MRAVVTHDYGAAPTVSDVDTPQAGPAELRVRVRASSLNGFDMVVAAGYLRGMMDHQFPVVLGRDFAGTVDQVGAELTDVQVGDEVFGVVLTNPLQAGGFGEYVVVPHDHSFAAIPAGLDHGTAGVLGLAGSAASAVVDRIAATPGQRVLIAGATGGVGCITIQLLAAEGVEVLATAGDPEEADLVSSLGATHVVDRNDLAAATKVLAPDGVDAAIHLAGDALALAQLVRPGGRLASLLMLAPDTFAGLDIDAGAVVATPTPPLLSRLANLVAEGRLRVPVQRTYALDEVPGAFADFAAGTRGKLGVTIA
jgi:NADPH:quinone reductase-like Zn-dependent oxidoreductase